MNQFESRLSDCGETTEHPDQSESAGRPSSTRASDAKAAQHSPTGLPAQAGVDFDQAIPSIQSPRHSQHISPDAPTADSVASPHQNEYEPDFDQIRTSYSSYKFLVLSNSSSLSTQNLSFLEVKGALHIPARPVLDEFMRQYFLHVHPMLPLIDEGDFWTTYEQTEHDVFAKTFSLLLFQAMIFASSNWLCTKRLNEIVKLLFDFATEKSPFVVSQAALLMTLWCSAEPKPIHSNSMWLQVAIQHARFVDAHLAWEKLSDPATGSLGTDHDIQMLKRLWWCCLVRDRSLSVGLGRSTQIATAHPPLCVSDFDNEIDRSKVNDAKTKQILAVVFTRLTHLCNNLTGILSRLWHSDDRDGLGDIDTSTFAQCRAKFQEWLRQTKLEIQDASNSCGVHQHCVIIHTNQMYIFYHHYSKLSQEVQEAVLGTVMCFEELTRLDLTRYLQASAMAFISLPLLFHLLDTKFFHTKIVDTDQHARHHRLQVLINAVKECRLRYEGAEWLSFALRHVINLVKYALPKSSLTSWTDLLAQKPRYCLTLTSTIDISLNQVTLPRDRDFPSILRGVLRPESRQARESPLHNIVETENTHGPICTEDGGFEEFAVLPGSGVPFETSSRQHEGISQSQASEDWFPENVILASNEQNMNIQDSYPTSQDIHPGLSGMRELSSGSIGCTVPYEPNHAQYSVEPFDAFSYSDLELDKISFDWSSISNEDDLFDML
ncbi:fungal specific transcription factor domain-containing protein [Fusarium austroafricanum]|uniref:Fungal specific transcription factor domain-containing protein n=1 Tax=Fusarium austroafricanum TaxID=2364996 RepID=A0A8H4NWI0_9HYPO|nr:fungal specific transcription factor domain-containing protein [Fusarium austroafricanum]